MSPQLAMEALQDMDARDVLVDALLEAGWLDDTWNRAHLRVSARRWAEAVVAELFKEYWSTKPWGTHRIDPEDFWNPQRMFVGVNRETDPLRLAGMRLGYPTIDGRLREVQRLIDRDVLSQAQAARLLDMLIDDDE
jgi:hypothetical protein